MIIECKGVRDVNFLIYNEILHFTERFYTKVQKSAFATNAKLNNPEPSDAVEHQIALFEFLFVEYCSD